MAIIKKQDKFNVFLSKIALNMQEGAHYFADYKINSVADLKVFSETMKDYETTGDSYIHEVIKELNNAFITPIEREDILLLAMCLDDVLDGIEHCSALFDMYNIVEVDDYMLQFVDAIRKSSDEIVQAIELLSKKKLLDMRSHVIQIKDYESKCDGILRQSIKNLFSVEKDTIKIIQLKEIYENLEEIADDCQNVANALETIIMKNA